MIKICKERWICGIISCFVCVAMLVLCIVGAGKHENYTDINEDEVPLSVLGSYVVNPTKADEVVMPDKYNTGAKGKLVAIDMGDTVQGVTLKVGNNGTANQFNFKIVDTTNPVLTFEGIDFSKGSLVFMNEYLVEKKVQVQFINCKFDAISTGRGDSQVSFSFKDCTIVSFKGSNATFEACRFGGTYKDALVPYRNVSVNNSFFCDMGSSDPAGGGVHTDATQIYGEKNLDVINVHYNNCRFEVPTMREDINTATVNACIMLQLEYSDGDNITFTDCTLNGGGYSMYASSKNGRTYKNVKFDNINIGCTRVYGPVYPTVCEGITLNNVQNTNSLYVGSVWKDNGKTYVSVTNDTNLDRTLVVFADGNVYEFLVEGSPNGNELYSDYSEYPFDVPVCIESDVDYLVCFDATKADDVKQIRYANWTTKGVVLSQAEKEKIADAGKGNKEKVILQGSCGKNATYELTNTGILTITGTGATESYHSQKRAPWFEDYRNDIREVVINDGITTVGNQMFTDCSYVEKVTLPKTLEIIGTRAFAKCTSILEITLPASLKSIYDSAFIHVLLQRVIYEGTEEAWKAVEVSVKNENLTEKMEIGAAIEQEEEIATCILSGECGLRGNNITFILDDAGVLTLNGEGKMANYHSRKNAPWHDYKDIITTVIVGEGITNVGAQAFISCRSIVKVELPNSLDTICNNAFQSCKKLDRISIPRNVKEIWAYAFHNTSLIESHYEGGIDAWKKVHVYQRNESLQTSMK
ncbi:MAG: leucine-rich repeat domain-containing protein [Lachnospiraceae bacterium]|nr:leucine-rich repeat domain-containing protein [Lachnospiraceae bacterium]